LLNAVHPDERVRVEHVLHEARRHFASFEIQCRVRLPDGSERFVHLQAEAPPHAGDSHAFLGTIQDVTERVRTEGAIRAAKEAAEEADRAKSQLLSMASHELRTPLTAIQGYIEMVIGDRVSELSDEQREFLGVAHRNSLQLAGLVNDLLDLARIEAGRLPLQVAPVDVEVTAQEVLATLMPHATAKGIHLQFAANGPEPQVVRVDPARFNQVLLNLVGNAVKFTERGTVTISTRADHGWIEITVSDTGPGIPAESLPYVFEAFSQGCPAALRQEGAGLGLAIVKQIVDLHGGSIAVHSAADQGSTFTVRLPAASEPAEPAA
jgi:signal transduction histidine kinase